MSAAASSSAAGADRAPSLAQRHSHVLPVFVFDPRFLGAGRSAFGFQKSSHIRARFLRECVEDLRRSLRARGSDLLVCCGSPELVIPDVCARVDARAVYAHSEWAYEEQQVETATAVALQKLNVQLRTCSGGTLVHLDDLPFDMAAGFPQTFTQFRSRVERNFQVRPSAKHSLLVSSVVLPLPPQVVAAASAPPPQASAASAASGAAAVGAVLDCSLPMPSFAAMGYDESEAAAYRPDPRSAFPFAGGESAALARVREWMWDQDRLRAYKETRNGMVGAEYSSKLSPFLAHVRHWRPCT
jgi:deoxyribodipyrimidine photo-lyase